MNISLRQLRAFVAGAESTSFSEAATKVHLTQPGYSLMIRQLEAEIGLKLFHRTTRRVELTAAGREFYSAILNVLKGLDSTLQDIRDVVSKKRGHVSVGIMPSVAGAFLGDVFSTMVKDYPAISLSIHEANAENLSELLLQNVLDFAISDELSASAVVQFTPLIDDPLVGLFQTDDVLLKKKTIGWKDVAQRRYVVFGRSSVQRHVSTALAASKIHIESVCEIANVATAVSLVRAGVGFAIVPKLALIGLKLGGVAVADIGTPRMLRQIGIAMHRQRPPNPASGAAIEVFTKVITKGLRKADG